MPSGPGPDPSMGGRGGLGGLLGGLGGVALVALLAGLGGAGALGSLVDQFRQRGFGDQVNSWVGAGQNQPIAPDQLDQALGCRHDRSAVAPIPDAAQSIAVGAFERIARRDRSHDAEWASAR
jgi:uncharacterized protein YidB (DUF937 family)